MFYTLEKYIGKGSSGEIYQIENDKVIKFMKKIENYLDPYISLYLNHPNIVKGYDVNLKNGIFSIIYEKGDDDLYNYMKEKRLTAKEKMLITKDIVQGVEFLHSFGIIHGDIKPHNILIFKNSELKTKLCDFNLSRFVNTKCDFIKKYYTLQYKPPEVLQGKINLSSDIWALGCTLYELWYNKKLFSSDGVKNYIGKYIFIDEIIKNTVCDERWDIYKIMDYLKIKYENNETKKIKHYVNLKKVKEKYKLKKKFYRRALFTTRYSSISSMDNIICNELKFNIYSYIT